MTDIIQSNQRTDDQFLTQVFLNRIEKYSDTHPNDDLNFLKAIPTITSENNHILIPEWHNGELVADAKQEVICQNYPYEHYLQDRYYAAHHDKEESFEEYFIGNIIVRNVAFLHKKLFHDTFLRQNLFDPIVPTVEWEISNTKSETLNSVPLSDVQNWCNEILEKSNKMPNCALISESVYKFLIHHESIRYMIPKNSNKTEKRKFLAELFELENVFTIGWIRNSRENKFVDCNSFLLYYSPENYDLDPLMHQPSTMIKLTNAKFNGKSSEFNTHISMGKDGFRGTNILYANVDFGLKISSRELGAIYKPENFII